MLTVAQGTVDSQVRMGRKGRTGCVPPRTSEPVLCRAGKAGELEHDSVLPPGGELRLPDEGPRDQGQEVKTS